VSIFILAFFIHEKLTYSLCPYKKKEKLCTLLFPIYPISILEKSSSILFSLHEDFIKKEKEKYEDDIKS